MKNVKIKSAFNYKVLIFIVIISLFTLSGCRSDILSKNNVPAPKTEEKPKAPPAPVVVDGKRTSYADLVEKTAPAVVQITAVQTTSKSKRQTNSPFENFIPKRRQEQPTRGFGSGVIISEDGYILTNHHVIGDATKITVDMNNKKSFEAKVIGSDPPSDLAIIKIEGEDFPFLKLGDSDEVRVGDIVLAIGNPLGIGQTVTSGIISAKGRQTSFGDGSFEDFLQTDAPINKGNSGGALINLTGELIGINSQILSSTGGSIGIGFAIPSNMATSVKDQLVKTGKVRRGMLGVNIQNISSEIAEQFDLKTTDGVLVSNVRKGSAAEKAGVKRYDVITHFNGEEVKDGNSLRNKVAGTQPETEITLTILREGKDLELKATLGEFDTKDTKKSNNNEKSEEESDETPKKGKLGLSLQPLKPEIAEQLKIPSEVKGVLVMKVEPDGPAAEKGIQRGDVIMEINREMVETLEDVKSALEKANDKGVLLLISRGGQTFFITVKPKE